MAFISHKVSVMSLLSLFVTSLLVYHATADNKSNQTSYKMQPPLFCYGCIPAMHDKPGSAGVPGRDGRDGREGAKGDQGSPGKTGPQGPTGPKGIRGAKGGPGVQGPPGQKGQRGDRGTNGIPGTPGTNGIPGIPGAMSYKNWKECVWNNLNEDKDNGLIKECIFTKNFPDTSLNVYWSGNLRIYGCNVCCKRWYFTFNGAECSAPLPIDGIVYLGTLKPLKAHDPHRVRHIEGHCNNIKKGKVRVGFWVGKCQIYQNRPADAYTGWMSVSRIYVEEVPKPQA